MQAKEDLDDGEAIEVTDAWWDKLNSVPFISCKYLLSRPHHVTLRGNFVCRKQGEDAPPPQASIEAGAAVPQANQADNLWRG